LTLRWGRDIPTVIAKTKHTDPIFSLQFSQKEGLILIHGEYEKKLNILSP